MSSITITRTVEAPLNQVWSILADFGGVYRFHPYVESSPLIAGQASGLGATRQCNFYDGNQVVEKVVGFEAERSMKIDIIEGSMPLACAQAVLEVEALDASRTRVTATMNYEPKYGPLGWLMDRMMMRRMFKRLFGDVLAGLETHANTGALIGEGGRVQAAA